MHIVMNVGGIPFNGDTINHRSLGGSESAAYYVAKELAERGHEVVMFTEHEESGMFDGVQYIPLGNRTAEAPLGENYHFYVNNTPHDVNICQRHPAAYIQPNQAKINLWWVHDLGVKRNLSPVVGQMWQIDAVMPVSQWFKDQLVDVWSLNPEIVIPIHNGVDYAEFDMYDLKDNSLKHEDEGKKPVTLIYSSRPERGLERLVKPGGIMERLLKKAPHVKLKVCGYDHAVPNLEGMYGMMRQRIEDLPNCEHMGALPKKELYRVMCEEADVWCYPTSFEEVSCITAMEAMAAGLTIVATNVAALPETLDTYSNCVLFNEEDVEDKFVNWLSNFDNRFRRRSHRPYPWTRTVDEIMDIITNCFAQRKNPDSVARHYLHNSDIVALNKLMHDYGPAIEPEIRKELDLYKWMYNQEDYAEHYADGTEEMYDSEDFHYEEGFEQHPRFQAVVNALLRPDRPIHHVVDYGCAHGHFTNYMARMFPDVTFTGIDVSPKAIAIAKAKADEWELGNVTYVEDDWLSKEDREYNCDVLILGEILEHVPDPIDFMETCRKTVGDDTYIVVTTPSGPWEAASYEKEYPKRYHLHHYERQDVKDMFEHYPDFDLKLLPAGANLLGEALGWYVYSFTFNSEVETINPVDYERKYNMTRPRQTVSLCVIAKDAENDLPRLLQSVHPFVDEIIVGIDANSKDETHEAVARTIAQINSIQHRSPMIPFTVVGIPPAVETGFDEARNETIKLAKHDWIMWADCDEEFISGERIWKYLRNNQWRGYGIPQHHFSTEPLGVLSTDYPVRLFRNHENVRFFGVVHEHPERPDTLNDGVKYAVQIYDVHFSHYGYKTETVRRARFERNVRLMARDRQKYPDRILGRFLWIRDLALMCRFELERTNGGVTPQMQLQASEGLKLWEETIDKYGDHKQTGRMIRDHLQFYDTLVNVIGQGFLFAMRFSTGIDSAPELVQVPELKARFLNRRHLDKFLSVVIDGEVKGYEEKYL